MEGTLGRPPERARRLNDGDVVEALDLVTIQTAISHELRAPLRAVIGFAEILNDAHSAELSSEARDYLGHVLHAGRRMEQLCERLLAFLRLGRVRIRSEPIDLARVLAEVARDLATALEGSGAVLTVGRELCTPLGDESLLATALRALIENATAYRRAGVAPGIGVEAVAQGELVVIRVSDNGVGIAAEDQEKMFRPLQRLVAEEDVPGIGVGLALARKAVLLQKGSIRVQSTPGVGSRFELRLPRAGARPGPAGASR